MKRYLLSHIVVSHLDFVCHVSIFLLGIHGYAIKTLDIAFDNNTFISAGYDRAIFYWDIASGNIIRKFQNSNVNMSHNYHINTVQFNHQEHSVIASGSYDKSISLWDIRDHNSYMPIQTMTDCKDAVSKLVLTGHEIIASCIDGKGRS